MGICKGLRTIAVLFCPGATEILCGMLAAKRMIFEFMPFSAGPAERFFTFGGHSARVSARRCERFG